MDKQRSELQDSTIPRLPDCMIVASIVGALMPKMPVVIALRTSAKTVEVRVYCEHCTT